MPYGIAKAENGVEIADNEDGTVTVLYANESAAKLAVTVKKEGSDTQYNYFLTGDAIDTNIPLTRGNGNYQISVLINIVDSQYSPLTTQKVVLQLADAKSAYLTSNQMISWEDTNNAIKKANRLANQYQSQTSKIKAIYKYLVKNFEYDYDKYKQNSNGNLAYYTPNIEDTFEKKKGICYDIATLTSSMMRSVGVQTQMITGYPNNQYFDGTQYHAWNKVYYKKYKKWVVMDITCDMCLFQQGVPYRKLIMKKRAVQYNNIKYIY